MYSAFISIVLISIILAAWTTYALIFQSSKSNQISKVIEDLYSSQKSVVVDVVDLSKILIKDNSKKITKENKNISEETEFIVDRDEDSLLDHSTITEDNGDNPLGIVIQQSIPEVNEKILPEINEEPLVNGKNESFKRQMEMIS